MDVDSVYLQNLRNTFPRLEETQYVLINQPNLYDFDAYNSQPLLSVPSINSPQPLVINPVPNNVNVSPQIMPSMVPFNNPMAPMSVINDQGLKINVVKAVWVPTASGQPENDPSTTASNTYTPNAGKPEGIEVTSANDDSEICCRICGKIFVNKDWLIDIFGSDGLTADLKKKIHRCLPITVDQSDELPSTVCKECIYILDLSFNLMIASVKTDQNLRYKLKKKKNPLANDKTPPTSSEPEVITLDSSSDENSDWPGTKLNHRSIAHTCMSRGSSPFAEDTEKSKENTANARPLSRNGSANPTECNLCGKYFKDIEAFLRHVEIVHINDLVKNRKSTESQPNKVVEDEAASGGVKETSLIHCFKCQEICLDEDDLQFHLNYECSVCDICGFKSRSRRSYVSHLRKSHYVTFEELQQGVDIVPEKTENSERGAVDGDSIDRGRGSAGENSDSDGDHKCSRCHKIFRSRHNFARHLKCHDPWGLERETKRFECIVCSRCFHNHNDLMKHRRLHFSTFPTTLGTKQFNSTMKRLSHEKRQYSVSSEKSQDEQATDDVSSEKSLNEEVTDGVSSEISLNEEVTDGLSSEMSLNKEVKDGVSYEVSLNEQVTVIVSSKISPNKEVTDGVSSEISLNEQGTNGLSSEISLNKQGTDGLFSEISLNKQGTDGLFSEISLNKEVTDGVSSELSLNEQVTDRVSSEIGKNKEVTVIVSSKISLNEEVTDGVSSEKSLNEQVTDGVSSELSLNEQVTDGVSSEFSLSEQVTDGVSSEISLNEQVTYGVSPEISPRENPQHTCATAQVCNYCGKIMPSLLVLMNHEQEYCRAKPWICEHCGCICRTKHSLVQHMIVHMGRERFLCPICNRGFSRKEFLRAHVKSHTGEKTYVCDVCDQQYSSSAHLNRHTRLKHSVLDDLNGIEAKIQKLSKENITEEVEKVTVGTQSEDVPPTSSSIHFSHTRDLASKSHTIGSMSKSHTIGSVSKSHTIDPPKCNVCSKEFYTVDQLQQHRFYVHKM